MTSENNVLHVFVLFCLVPFILCMCIFAMDSLPVQAAELANKSYVIKSCWDSDSYNGGRFYYEFSRSLPKNVFDLVFQNSDGSYYYLIYSVNFKPDLTYSRREYTIKSDGSFAFDNTTSISTLNYCSGVSLSNGDKVYFNRSEAHGYNAQNKNLEFETTLPIYGFSNEFLDITDSNAQKNFFEHLLVTGDLVPSNAPSIDNPDFEDTAYAFTGFTANNKMTATWTGTTERTYLQDQEVEEYVRVNYYFADREAQDTIKQADAYPDEFATADKTLTIDVSGLKPDDKNWFLRYIRITPCYRQAGLGAWGDFYHGEPSYVYFNQDGSIDRIDAPFIKGELSSDMERPVIVLHEAANGNPTESDYSYFEFNNAQSDYFFEMKGRWYTTNDFDLYRDKLVWKYKYSTLLKNNLSTWVSVSDNRSSVGRFQFDVLGKSSWDNLLSSYPVDDRNYIGGSYDLFNKITGYSDALDTLKMLLKQPYSLFNGYEVYVRYFRFDENGGIQYSKWTHFYNNLADSEGSSGSRLDDLDNMYSENQSDKGLTDDELSDLEDGGNSRNDLDAVPKNNYDYSSLENATMNFFDLLTNFGTMLGQFPSMVAAVFSFLPSWLIGLIAVAIGAVIFCRFIGR